MKLKVNDSAVPPREVNAEVSCVQHQSIIALTFRDTAVEKLAIHIMLTDDETRSLALELLASCLPEVQG